MLERVLGKVEVSGQIGDKLDEVLKAAEGEVHQRKGMQAGCQLSAKAVVGLLPHVDKDFEEGDLEGLNALEIQGLVKKWLVRASESIENLYQRAKAEEMVAHGKVVAMETAVTVVKRYHDSAAARHTQLTAPPEPDDEGEERKGRRSGEHPGVSSLDERRAQAARAKAAQYDAEAAEKVADTAAKTAAKKAPAKKKRAVKKRAPKKAPKKGA